MITIEKYNAEKEDNYRDILRKGGYPEEVLSKLTDEECEAEYDAVEVIGG
ncbi:hypothetical protein [Brevibacillus porteri]|nr:hypothetical protein [Brevibacillus porteri]MED1800666.1 hypothetical protein [Brevibacillus porteri]MED2134706.1 hypothetical protein [Brevibacillus porteri]MED2747460.1 hypothetical protein [Brevibacillus porteri]MED2818399.1 hypothetical protein [Brevibacillus porteri]MED2894772.1 hypothetical protein [Brevibacillus porteri]